MNKKRKYQISILLIFLMLQIYSILGLYVQKRVEFIKDAVFVTVLYILYIIYENKKKLHTSNYIKTLIALALLGHSFFGKFLDLYKKIPYYDKIFHIIGTYIFSLFFYELINQLFKTNCLVKSREFIFIIFLGIGLGVLFEIMEFGADLFFKPKIHNQISLWDTDIDMIMNIAGAIAAALHALWNKPENMKYK